MEKEIAIEVLNELKLSAQKITDHESLKVFKNSAVNNIIRVYGKESEPEKQVKQLRSSGTYGRGSLIPESKRQAEQLMDSLIKEIERFGLPETSIAKVEGLNITINQSQNQSVKINLSLIIESIRDELTGAQLKEIQEIIENKALETSEKKKTIMQKIVGFGKDVGANIIANILTNPNLYA